jgi:hypothetical protein
LKVFVDFFSFWHWTMAEPNQKAILSQSPLLVPLIDFAQLNPLKFVQTLECTLFKSYNSLTLFMIIFLIDDDNS